MPQIQGRIRYVQKLPKYETEKPFIAAIPEGTVDLEKIPITNLEYEEKLVDFVDVRQALTDFTLQTSGFQFLSHKSKYPRVSTTELDGYQRETEDVLKKLLDAEEIVCYDFRVRLPLHRSPLVLLRRVSFLASQERPV
ncbi:hypothetical protein PFICI_11891 [Pestalotiopsis fici W106-1]|uniref:Uncharacterized protein n=1 Tax=Pestalotiopsis fici (strain W106-1 / CGMCC3.15140) TaxID=1229662 RepID=W3WRP0_PESFW|nr:uncharacterized protein PFICI_11891 [Pestalotiopsis fici W106-1]ETS76504.1 hypothetical protein PFICI_11891 [Pestalotiopsis fici W106-1]